MKQLFAQSSQAFLQWRLDSSRSGPRSQSCLGCLWTGSIGTVVERRVSGLGALKSHLCFLHYVLVSCWPSLSHDFHHALGGSQSRVKTSWKYEDMALTGEKRGMKAFQACPTWRKWWGIFRIHWRYYVFWPRNTLRPPRGAECCWEKVLEFPPKLVASAAWPQIRSRSWMEEILLQLKFVNNEEKVNSKLKKRWMFSELLLAHRVIFIQ